jgi:hypothetical protein
MLTQTPNVGQRYIAAYKDSNGQWLTGGDTYRLHVPPNPPTKQFWSVTAYDEDTRQMPVTPQGRPDISFRSRSTSAPRRAGNEANWVQTVPGKGWSSYFRFYGPTEPFFDKSWGLPDFEKIN